MALSVATLFIVLAIAPGFALFAGAAAAMGITRNDSNTVATIIIGATLGIVAHGVALALVWVGATVQARLQWREPGWAETLWGALGTLVDNGTFVAAQTGGLIAYATWAVLVGLGLGWAFGWLVREHRLPLSMFHGPYYDYVRRDDGVTARVSVVTRTEIEGRLLCYDGVLKEITPARGAGFAAVALYRPQRFLMARDRAKGTAFRGGELVSATSGDRDNVLFINADQIANLVVFRRVTAD